MNKEIDFETNLIISYRKFEIFLFDIKNHKNIYQEEFKFRAFSEKLDLNRLNEFLENNIFKVVVAYRALRPRALAAEPGPRYTPPPRARATQHGEARLWHSIRAFRRNLPNAHIGLRPGTPPPRGATCSIGCG